jgi:FkbM family methyltransferase
MPRASARKLLARLRSALRAAAGRATPAPLLDGAAVADEPATLADVVYCYRLFLQRHPDPTGFDAYSDQVRRGTAVKDLVSYFVGCPEWVARGLFKTAGNRALERVETADFPLYVLPTDPVVARELLATGAYEPHVAARLRELLKPGDTFVDVGANVGYHAILAARCVGPTGRVLAFEPSAANVKALALNRSVNRVEHLEILPFALSDTEGLLSLMKIVSIASTKEVDPTDLEYLNDVDVVYAAPLDKFVAGARRLDLIKCDVDGHDHLVMKGARAALERFRPRIIAEFNPGSLESFSRVEPKEYLEYLLGFGHEMRALLRTGEVIDCGRDPARPLELVAERRLDQVDLLFEPRSAA